MLYLSTCLLEASLMDLFLYSFIHHHLIAPTLPGGTMTDSRSIKARNLQGIHSSVGKDKSTMLFSMVRTMGQENSVGL